MDFNNDGIPDVVLLDTGNNAIELSLGGVPRGDLYQAQYINPTTAANCTYADLAIADFNGDGFPDVAFTCASNGGWELYIGYNQAGTLSGLPGTANTNAVDYGPVYGPYLTAGDFNHDGHMDLVVGETARPTQNGPDFATYLGNGLGGLAAGPVTATATMNASMIATDWNQDGYMDLAVENTSGTGTPGVTVFENDHTGAFGAGSFTVPTASSASFTLQPLTGSYPSVLIVDAANAQVGVAANPASGAFSAAAPVYTAVPGLSSAVWGDFNGDALLDVATYNGTNLGVLTGDGTGLFTLTALASTGAQQANLAGAQLLSATDQNGDGLADVLAFTGGSQSGSTGTLTGYITSGTTLATLKAGTLASGSHTVSATAPGSVTTLGSTGQLPLLVSAPVTPTINWTPPAPITWNAPLTTAQLDAQAVDASGAAVPGTYAYNPPLNTVLAPGTYALQVAFTPADAASYTSATQTVKLVVNQATPGLKWTAPAAISYGTALTGAQLDAVATGVNGLLAGQFVYTPLAGSVLKAGLQTLSVNFTPADQVDYTSVTRSVQIQVTPAIPGVNWPVPAAITYGTALSGAQLDASSPVAGSFVYTPAAGTVLPAGMQTLSVVFTPVDAQDNVSVTKTIQLLVNQATHGFGWLTPAPITYGTPLSNLQLDATSSVPGTFTYTPKSGAILTAGIQMLSVVFTPTDTTDYGSVTQTVQLLVNKATPALAWPAPTAIVYGTALSAAQLDASAAGVNGAVLPGTFAYTPPLKTVLAPGTQTLSALFTPTDSVDYNTAAQTVQLVVNNPTTAGVLGSSLNPSHYGQTVTLTLTLTPSASTATMPMGTVTLRDGSTTIGTASLQSGTASFSLSTLTAGSHNLTAFYGGDGTYGASTTPILTQVVQQAAPVVSWTPAGTSIPYGTALTNAQLNATFASPYGGAAVAGKTTYTPALGVVLTAGTQTLSVTLQPQDALDFASVTRTVTITVTQVKPTITWPTPANLVAGSPLTGAQLDATVTGVTGAVLAGTAVYTPPLGSIAQSGPQTLTVSFTPADAVDYTSATASVFLNGTPLTLAGVAPATALLGDPAKAITLTGTGFLTTSTVLVNGSTIPSVYVSPTTLTATVTAADFLNAGTLAVTVSNAQQNQTSAAANIVVSPPPVPINFNAPPTPPASGQQPAAGLTLTNPYPVDLIASVDLTFKPLGSGPDDPNVVFLNNTRTLTFTIPANSTVTPNIQFQTGTVAGTITLTLNLSAGGVNVTPASVLPITLVIPQAVPSLSNVTFTQQGTNLSVSVTGFSNTLEITQATFHFTGANGATLANPDITVQAGPDFAVWYGTPQSPPYGSEFDYTQTFTLDEVTPLSQVTVTLSNSIGRSLSGTSPATP